jgi:SAM-dependent methyltransferase
MVLKGTFYVVEVHVLSTVRAGWELFLVSLLVLFLELACIRWLPAHVLFLTFFTNTVLLACFLGMSVGCLAAGRDWNLILWTPVLLALALAAGHGIEYAGIHQLPRSVASLIGHLIGGTRPARLFVDVGHQASPQFVFFGTEAYDHDVAHFVVPIEVIAGFFFVVIALAMTGPGQELGRALKRMPNRVVAYTLNILGSIVGIALFGLCSWRELPPLGWFLLIGLLLGYFLFFHSSIRWTRDRWPLLANLAAVLIAIVTLASVTSGINHAPDYRGLRHYWSPYYRIDYTPPPVRNITVNLIGHQQMVSREDEHTPAYAYALPYLLRRDSGASPFKDVLIIGAGSGNDISRALQWNAQHVDAVEIDPVIRRLGAEDHPDRPYEDPRVSVHLDDGRNYLRSTDRKYDLIVYALVDSLVLHSSYSNIRLESYLFTRQAFEDVRRCLKPDGVFVMYNYFRQGWIVARLRKGLEEVFQEEPVILTLPYREVIDPDEAFPGYTMFFTHNTQALRDAFQKYSAYWLAPEPAPSPRSPNGFTVESGERRAESAGGKNRSELSTREGWERFGPAKVITPVDLEFPTDDWPFLYLRDRMIPDLSLRGMAVMGGISLLLILLFQPKSGTRRRLSLNPRMLLLGAGFMLIETKAVVHMALLFGSTWMVNSIVFFAVLVMILAANLFVLTVRPLRLWPYYIGLLATLAANALVPLDFFLGMDRQLQVISSCLLVFAPILFAGIVFATSFGRSTEPDRDFGANIAGAILGGLAENASMLLGFQHLMVVAIAFYALSALPYPRSAAPGEAS